MQNILDVQIDDGQYYDKIIAVINDKLKQAVVNYNSLYMKKQIRFIESGRSYSKMYNNTIKSGNIKQMEFDILSKVGNQVSVADEFFSKI